MASNLRGTRNKGRRHERRKGKKLSWSTVCTDIVLVGTELTTLSGDALQILLGRGVGIANLEKKSFLANWLAMKLLDDLLADVATLKTDHKSAIVRTIQVLIERSLPSKANATAVLTLITKDSA